MNKRTKDIGRSIPPHHQSAVVAEPSDGAFDLPSFAIAPEGAAVLAALLFPIPAMRRNLLDTAGRQAVPEGIAVIRLVHDQAFGFRARATRTSGAYAHRAERFFRERDLRRTGRMDGYSQRNTLAVCQYHKLCALPAFGLSDITPPFLAGAKVPSRKASFQSIPCCPLSSARKARQMFNQMSWSAHIFNRRQQVLGLGYRSGKSCQRAPVRRIQRMPSRHERLFCHGRPRLLNLGRWG